MWDSIKTEYAWECHKESCCFRYQLRNKFVKIYLHGLPVIRASNLSTEYTPLDFWKNIILIYFLRISCMYIVSYDYIYLLFSPSNSPGPLQLISLPTSCSFFLMALGTHLVLSICAWQMGIGSSIGAGATYYWSHLIDQPDFILRLEIILLQGQNTFIPVCCKIWI